MNTLEHELANYFAEHQQDTLTAKSAQLLDAQHGQTTTTFCQYSGLVLHKVPTIFSTERSVQYAQHWIFGQSFQQLQKLHYQQRTKNHEQRSLLALAMLLNPATLGNQLAITNPVVFDPILLQRNYSQLVWIAETLAGLDKRERAGFLNKCPKFTSRTFTEGTSGKQEPIALGKQFIHFICQTITELVYQKLNMVPLSDDTLVDDQVLKLELEHRRTNSATRVKHTVATANYWQYILDDIQNTYSLDNVAMGRLRQQVKTPSDLKLLIQLKSLVKGIADFNTVNGLQTIPSIQLTLAVAEISKAITEIEKFKGGLDLSLETVVESVIKPTTDSTGTTTTKVVTQVTKPIYAQPLQSSSPALRTVSSRLQGLANRQQSRLDKTKKDAVDFVIQFADSTSTTSKESK